MQNNPQATIQKYLLIVTALIVVAFIATFPTRDRRGFVDQIRLKTGATNLVSKKTLKELAQTEKNKKIQASARTPASSAKTRPNLRSVAALKNKVR